MTADGTFVDTAVAQGGGGAQQRGPSRSQRRESEKEDKDRRKREESKAKSAARHAGEGKNGCCAGVNKLHIFMLLVMFGPAIFPFLLLGGDFLASTPAGVAAYNGCIDIGLCSSYHDQLAAIYERENPKKVSGVGTLLKKWKGKEAQVSGPVWAPPMAPAG